MSIMDDNNQAQADPAATDPGSTTQADPGSTTQANPAAVDPGFTGNADITAVNPSPAANADTVQSPATPATPGPKRISDWWPAARIILLEVGRTALIAIAIFVVIRSFTHNFMVAGESMTNNLQDGEYLLVNKVAYASFWFIKLGDPQRGDVIIFKPPHRGDRDYVKRIVGLPGDRIKIVEGRLHINGNPVDEPFKPNLGSYNMLVQVVVPKGHVFVLGDNRNASNDSHNWGPVSMDNIIGKAWLCYWPPERMGGIPGDAPTETATLQSWLSGFLGSSTAWASD